MDQLLTLLRSNPPPIALAEKGKAPSRFLLIRDGDVGFGPDSAPNASFVMNEVVAEAIIAEFNKHGSSIPIDWHHATEKVQPGQKASAAGHIAKLEYEQGVGLFAAQIEWTEEGRKDVESRAFIHTSPAIFHTKGDNKKIVSVSSVALTNTPRTVDATELTAAAERIRQGETEMTALEKLKATYAEHCKGLHVTMAQEGVAPAMTADMKAIADLMEVLKSVGVDVSTDSDLATIIGAAIEHIKATSGDAPEEPAAAPDEEAEKAAAELKAKAAMLEPLNKQVVDLTKRLSDRDAADAKTEVDAFMAEQVTANKINPNDEKAVASARAFAEKDLPGAVALFETIQPYAPAAPTTSGAPDPGGSKRKTEIATAEREFTENGVTCEKRFYVDQHLRENKLDLLTAKEVEALA